ncbi:hypothetical protein LLH23_23655 [bacterium]|nr:hypothetical protein [bacterium]
MYLFSADFWTDMGLRLTGPAALRFVIQPILAVLFGVRDGVHDARSGEPPFIYDIVMVPADRKRQASRGWAGIGKAVIFATVLDAVIQYPILGQVYPGAAIVVGAGMMGLPYALVRGIANRIASRVPSVRLSGQKDQSPPRGENGRD